MAIQLLGQDGTTVQKVDPTFGAARVSIRPAEVTTWQSIGAQSGLMTLVAANGAIFSLRNLSSNLLLVRRVGIGYTCTTGYTAAQKIDFGLMVARAMTTSDTGGTAIALVANNTKLRTSMNTFTSVDCRISTTAALGAGTKTLDTNHLSQIGGWTLAATAGVVIPFNSGNLFSHDAGDHPIVLGMNEGINIMNLTVGGAAGVGIAYINIEVAEATSF
jgi:hypothetical protein